MHFLGSCERSAGNTGQQRPARLQSRTAGEGCRRDASVPGAGRTEGRWRRRGGPRGTGGAAAGLAMVLLVVMGVSGSGK